MRDKTTLYFLYNVVDESGFKKIAQTLHLQRKHGIFWRLHTEEPIGLDKSGFKLSEESLKA